MFGKIPSYGFFIRHAGNIKMNDIELNYINTDSRPPFIFEDVKGIYLDHISVQKEKDQKYFILKDISDFHISQSRNIEDKDISNVVQGAIP